MKEREHGIDIVKTVAVLFVVGIHFYLATGYYSSPIGSMKMYVMTVGRWLFITGVPLFMIITGYLKKEKLPSKSHYMSIIPILISYVVICSFRMILEHFLWGEAIGIESVKKLLSYQSAWYVGMYVGLMLICPFINILWKNLSKKEHQILAVSMVMITMMYSLIGYVFPYYFQGMYPITYYIIGMYIREYKPQIAAWKLIFAGACAVGINCMITFICSRNPFNVYNAGYLDITDSGQNVVTVAITSVCVFLLLYQVRINNKFIYGIINHISRCSLEIYLIQAAINTYIFQKIAPLTLGGAEGYFWWFFITVPLTFICSWIIAAVYRGIYDTVSAKIK